MSDLLMKAVRADLGMFKLKFPTTTKLPSSLFVEVGKDDDLYEYYSEDVSNSLCEGSMSDIDNHVCRSAQLILGEHVGTERSNEIMFEVIDEIGDYYKAPKYEGNDRWEFLINYLGTQAFAIPIHWHARRLKISYEEHVYEERIWALARPKYEAFGAGLVPVGTRGDDKSASMLVWRPWVE